MVFAQGIALGLRPRAIPRATTIFHGMSLLSSTYCYSIKWKAWAIMQNMILNLPTGKTLGQNEYEYSKQVLLTIIGRPIIVSNTGLEYSYSFCPACISVWRLSQNSDLFMWNDDLQFELGPRCCTMEFALEPACGGSLNSVTASSVPAPPFFLLDLCTPLSLGLFSTPVSFRCCSCYSLGTRSNYRSGMWWRTRWWQSKQLK